MTTTLLGPDDRGERGLDLRGRGVVGDGLGRFVAGRGAEVVRVNDPPVAITPTNWTADVRLSG